MKKAKNEQDEKIWEKHGKHTEDSRVIKHRSGNQIKTEEHKGLLITKLKQEVDNHNW